MALTYEQRRAAALKAWVTIRAKRAGQGDGTLTIRKSAPSLLDFIHARGGLDLRSLPGERRSWMQSERGRRPGLFRNSRCALGREEMMTAANDEGFGPFEDEREFFDAIDNEARGFKRYQRADDIPDDEGPSALEWSRYASYMIHCAGVCPTCNQPVAQEAL